MMPRAMAWGEGRVFYGPLLQSARGLLETAQRLESWGMWGGPIFNRGEGGLASNIEQGDIKIEWKGKKKSETQPDVGGGVARISATC